MTNRIPISYPVCLFGERVVVHTRIFDVIASHVPHDARIEDVCIGIFWTFVRTQYGAAISATAHRWLEDPPGVLIPNAGSLVGSYVKEMIELYDAPSLTARALANAAVSASFSVDSMTGQRHEDKAQHLLESICASSSERKRIALIGHFHFADALRELGHQLDIYELENRCGPEDMPSTLIPERLPCADIVVMTSSTLITHATEEILSCCRPDAFKMIVGPTVPLHPALWDFGFDAICGNAVTDAAQVSRAAREGGNHRQLTGCQKINFIKPSMA